MEKLFTIQEYVQNIAETIQSVVGVDVTIVDINNLRVAGTGKYKDKIGSYVVDTSVFIKSMKEKKCFIVENPKKEKICMECENRKCCIEYAEVCCPILINNSPIGVIGLVALSETQRKALKNNEYNLLEFLKRMGDLLGVKLIECERVENEKVMLKQIETIINSIDDGIIAIDANKNRLYSNEKVNFILNIDINDEYIRKKVLITVEIDNILLSGHDISNKQVNINGIDIVINAKPILLNKKIIGAVIIVRTIKDVKKIINDITTAYINTNLDEIVGKSEEIDNVKEISIKASRGDSTVLILGESGTGKEMFARSIHSLSNRHDKPFIAINCAAIPESLLESELFGYEEGSFTGAKKGGKIGKFEIANGGTVFLDEIGDMPIYLQTKLLRVLQERVIEKIGSVFPQSIDVRIIAATHKNIYLMAKEGDFRQDLFYRLNVIPIKIPALRDRKGDIGILMEYLLKKCSIKLNKKIYGFSSDLYKIFNEYPWPGNVRELENAIEYAVNMEASEYIKLESLPQRLKEKSIYDENYNLKEIEKRTIENVLKKYKNKDYAAKVLGIGRATLFRKIKEYNIVSL